MYFNLLVEGYVDEAVGRRILLGTGHEVGTTFGKKGWTYIEKKIAAFDSSCAHQWLLTLIDCMDTGKDCPVHIVREWVPQCADKHIFRVVVREIESWILADRNGISNFLSVPLAKIPLNPDALPDPKRTLINLARTSRAKSIRSNLVPRELEAATEGPLYSSEMVRFVTDIWDPDAARQNSASLERCLCRLTELHGLHVEI